MKTVLKLVAILAVLAVGAVSGLVAFGTAEPPPPLQSIGKPFEQVDFSDLPPIQRIEVSGSSPIAYRVWQAGTEKPTHVIIAIHGSSATSGSLHPLAKALSANGMSVYAPDIRGHGETGTRGDIDYASQLDDDMAALVASVREVHPDPKLVLLGLSAGGGFALHLAARPIGEQFDGMVLLAPMLGVDAPTVRDGVGGWARPYIPRIIGLRILNRFGIDAFNGLPVLAFAVRPEQKDILTSEYSYRLLQAFGTDDYVADLRQAATPIAVIVAGEDELFYPEKFAPTVKAVRPEALVTVVPGVTHIGITLEERASAAIRDAIRGS